MITTCIGYEIFSYTGKSIAFAKINFVYCLSFSFPPFPSCKRSTGFRPGDSKVNQLISITHTIFKAFDCNPSLDVRSVYLDISKAFDRVWHDGLIYKLKRCGVSGKLLSLIQSFLKGRKQRTVLNGKCSNWGDISAGVPQGSILGPLFFSYTSMI